MKDRKQLKLLITATSASLILSMVMTATAIADDNTPPPPTDEPVVSVTVEPVVSDVLPSTSSEDLMATEVPANLPDLMDQFPENTSVVVVVDDVPEPLATQDAANTFLIGDPIWCPESVAPDPLANGCTDSYPDLYSLIDDIDSAVIPEPAENGTIWIMAGVDNSLFDISIDGTTFATWSTYALTLQGGWDGSVAGNITGTSIFSVPLSIENWGNAVTISQINIANANSTGLTVSTSGDIVLDDVSSNGNDGAGAELISSAGSISIIGDSAFDDNKETGLYVDANGDIDAENVGASNNGAGGIFGGGAELYSLGSITLSGTNNVFMNNYETGLYLEADGQIDGQNITANSNGVSGALIYSSGGLSLTGTNVFTDNNETGLYAEIVGSIASENVTASANGAGSSYGYGAELYSLGSVNLSGVNVFNGNYDSGLYVEASNDVTAENLTASQNGVAGGQGNGAELYSLSSLTLTGINVFGENLNSGLYLVIYDDVVAENITANSNGVSGVLIYSSGGLSLTGTNVFTGNDETGLYAEIVGNIASENVTANANGAGGIYGYGAELYSLGSVDMSGVNIFNGNYDSGLYVEAGDSITVENLTASENGVAGGQGNGAELYSLSSLTLTGINVFNNNYSNGLLADSSGEININYADASGNGLNGMYLETDVDATVTCGKLAGNAAYEMKAYISGVLTLNGVDFGGDFNDLQVDTAQLILNSNDCFSYPVNSDDGDDEDSGSNTGNSGVYLATFENPPIKTVEGVGGQTITLDCDSYSGTYLVLLNGDGAYIPCPIVDSANLFGIPVEALPRPLASSQKFVSSFNLSIAHDGQILTSGEVTDQVTPFMKVFFLVPEVLRSEDLAILYWDGFRWVELTDGLNLDNGRLVKRGGHKSDDGLYFEATVNFIGTFVLVQK